MFSLKWWDIRFLTLKMGGWLIHKVNLYTSKYGIREKIRRILAKTRLTEDATYMRCVCRRRRSFTFGKNYSFCQLWTFVNGQWFRQKLFRSFHIDVQAEESFNIASQTAPCANLIKMNPVYFDELEHGQTKTGQKQDIWGMRTRK